MTASDLVTDTSVEKPDEWPMRTAASFNPFITSGSRGWAKYYADHGDLFMRITNLKRHRIKPDLSDRQHVALPASEKEGLRTGLRHGDILISITADIGIIGFVDEHVPTPAYINQHVACLRLPADQVSPKFVAYYLASSEPQRRFIEMTDVGAKTGINLTTVGKLTFPCPPLAEQEAIAEALSDADALIEGLERLIAKKRLIKQGAMQDLLTAKRRLPGFSGEWEVKKLGSIAQLYQSQTIAQSSFSKGGYPVYGANGIVGYFSRFNHSKPQLMVSCRGNCGTVNRTHGPAWITGNAMVVNLHNNDHTGHFEFMFQLLSVTDFSLVTTGSGQPQIVRGPLSELEVIIPAEFDEQTAIATIFSDMDAEIQALETRLVKARQVKEGMMQNLLTGRIRLV